MAKQILLLLVLISTLHTQRQTATNKKLNVVILLYQDVELIDFAGPAEVFANIRDTSGMRACNVITVAYEADTVFSQHFLTIRPQYNLANCPQPDILIIPGGDSRIPISHPKVIQWVKKVSQNATYILSVCTGAFILAKTSLLDGHTVTTHSCCTAQLQMQYPDIKVLKGMRYIDNGKIISTEGTSAGIDGSLYQLTKMFSQKQVQAVADWMMYDWNPGKLNTKVVSSNKKITIDFTNER